MSLDNFDSTALEQHGDPVEILKRLYNKDVNTNNAYKYLTGIRLHLKTKAALGESLQELEGLDEIETKSDGTQTSRRMILLSDEDRKSPRRIMQLMGYDPLQWETINCKVRRNIWNTTIKSKEGEPIKSTNHAYSVTLTVKPIQALITANAVREALEGIPAPAGLERHEYQPGHLMLELPILDFHLGKLAWAKETGEDYDLKIAERLYRETIQEFISRIKAYNLRLERIIYPVGQDFYHIDTTHNTTTSGTQLDTDTRWAKLYQKGIHTLVWATEQLRALAPVEIMYVPGNHDRMLSYCATETLAAYYRETPGVKVDTNPAHRKYIQYGVNLIGYSHGKEGKRIETLMQVEAPEAWAATKYREWHLGDLHHEAARETGGIIIRRISALTATDAWHSEMGYKGAIRKAQGFVWDRETGKALTIDVNARIEPDA